MRLLLLTFGNRINRLAACQLLAICFCIAFVLTPTPAATQRLEEGDPCQMNSISGVCTLQSRCTTLEAGLRNGLFSDVVSCGFGIREEIICCPIGDTNTGNTPIPFPTGIPVQPNPFNATPVITRSKDRPAVEACRIIDANLEPSLTRHILGGTPVELGEYPHMAAIGYSRIGNDQGPYDFRCGGTLIDKKFVLTAAHCVISRDNQPAIVRLGITNFTNPQQLRDAVEIRIKEVHIHPEYIGSRKYHDIALLELGQEVTYSKNIYPTCLYAELSDPAKGLPLYVTGFGTVNTDTRQYSNVLLKAKLDVVPIERCNQSYIEVGLNRQLERGIEQTQMCAFDSGNVRDACQGDSGGPLNLVLDESSNKYRVVGIISAGFSCASQTPGLYTRVAAYLDYIESIVWPQ